MRDQYVGDISDYLKFAFLRAVTPYYTQLGMAWYYLPEHDGRPDGNHTEYLAEPAWLQLDPPLYHSLKTLPERSVASLESADFWPTRPHFHRTPVATPTRHKWVETMAADLDTADFIFLDPDNGVGRHHQKHARITDLVALQRSQRAMAIIKFPGRNATHAEQIASLHQNLIAEGLRRPITVSTCVCVAGRSGHLVPRQRFFTLVDGNDHARQQVRAFADRLNSLPAAARASAYCVA